MDYEQFENDIMNSIRTGIQRTVSKGEFFQNPYNERININPIVKNIYSKMDHKRLENLMIEKLEEVVAEKVVNKLVTEMGTDIKSLMSNATIRDDFRFFLRKQVEKILDKVREN